MVLRMRERDIAAYRTRICPRDTHDHRYPWDSSDSYFQSKWEIQDRQYKKTRPDPVEDCEDTGMFLSWGKSVLTDHPLMHEALQ
jgi:hypothetical protein